MQFKAWLKQEKRTLDWLAGELGISVTSAWRLVNGGQEPSLSAAETIVRMTEGAVSFDDLLATYRAAHPSEAA